MIDEGDINDTNCIHNNRSDVVYVIYNGDGVV